MKIPFRRSLSKLHARRDSTQSQNTVPLLRRETIEETSHPNAENVDPRYRDAGEATMVRHGHDTMLDLITQKKAELLHFGSEQNMSTLQDLSNMLYTRGRLQELGCTFTPPGELLTYGHPATLHEFEQLLRLGPIYDEQWSLFFNREAAPQVDVEMWSDMRTLKRVLANEGVTFGQDHHRWTFGDGSSKLLRLCAAYDDLYKLWSAMLPERALTPHREEEDEAATDANDDSGCFIEDEIETHGGVEVPVMLDAAADEALRRDLEHIEYETRPGFDVPRNIGWRFSDDIDEANSKRFRESASLSDEEFDKMEAAAMEDSLALAVAVPLPEDHSRPSSPVPTKSAFRAMKSKASMESLGEEVIKPESPFKTLNKKASKESLKAGNVRAENPFKALNSAAKQSAKADFSPHPPHQLRRGYGPSPLQAVTTISMVCVDDGEKTNVFPAAPQYRERLQEKETRYKVAGSEVGSDAKKKKGGLRGWAKGVWEKAWSPMQDAQKDGVGPVGGWW